MLKKYKHYSQPLLRYGIGIVFLLFGIMQFTNVSNWATFIPNFLTYILKRETILIFISILNFTVGLFLILGFYVRLSALLAALHLINVIIIIGFNPTSIRDFGLLLAAISILLNGPDKFCIKK